MNLFLALDGKLRNKFVRFEKPRATRKKLKTLAISLKKILASTETLSQKPNPTSGQNCKPQSQRSDAMSSQKQKPKEGKQAGSKGLKDPKRKKPHLKCYNCDKTGHIAKECYAPKKKRRLQEFGKRRRPVSRMSALLALVDSEIDHSIKPNTNIAGGALLPRSAIPSAQSIDKLQSLNTI